jgi:NAD(P)-dependent dehydrogenase (short-subunit alcohol dehydrogenase family)
MSNGGKRVAWVTGGGSGIGEAGAEALAADGWTVVVSGRRKDVLEAVVAKIGKSGGTAKAIPLDVSIAVNVEKAAGQILAEYGRIDLLVNSAGINVPKRSWADMDLEGWDRLVEINLNGVLYCMRAVLPAMRAQKDGCIINVASWAGRHVSKMPGPAYTTTKHAVLALTHSFNMDVPAVCRRARWQHRFCNSAPWCLPNRSRRGCCSRKISAAPLPSSQACRRGSASTKS